MSATPDDYLRFLAQQLAAVHIRRPDGTCDACLTGVRHLVRYPCGPARWAAAVAARELTRRFLTGSRDEQHPSRAVNGAGVPR